MIDDRATVDADGNVIVTALGDAQIFSLTGELAIGRETGAGASIGSVVSVDITEARIGENAGVTARGMRGTTQVPIAERTNPSEGADREEVTGVAVSAISFDDLLMVAIGANVGIQDAGVSGSVGAVITVDSTKAVIESGAKIKPAAEPAADSQDVLVRAAAKRNMLSTVGVGCGLDAAVGVSVASNLIVQFVSATVNDADVRAGDVTVEATTDNLAIAGAVGVGVSASTDPGAEDLAKLSFAEILPLGDATSSTFSGTGSVAGNVIFSAVEAVIDESDVTATGAVDVTATEDTVFAAGAGGVAITATNTIGSAAGGAVAASLSGNVIVSDTEARISCCVTRSDWSTRGVRSCGEIAALCRQRRLLPAGSTCPIEKQKTDFKKRPVSHVC